MSDASLFSGLYQQIHEYAELLDSVLVNLKENTSSLEDKPRQELASFLLDLTNEQCRDLPVRLIALALRDNKEINLAELSDIGQALQSADIDESVIESLERLAQSLEQEQTGAMERMRGRSY